MLGMAFGLSACATRPPSQPIAIDTKGMKNLKDLIAGMKQATGSQLDGFPDESFYKSYARAFVDHAIEAAEKHNIPIPDWILEKLSYRKTVVPVIAAPAVSTVIFAVGEATFSIVLWDFFALALVSLASIALFIKAILPEKGKSKT